MLSNGLVEMETEHLQNNDIHPEQTVNVINILPESNPSESTSKSSVDDGNDLFASTLNGVVLATDEQAAGVRHQILRQSPSTDEHTILIISLVVLTVLLSVLIIGVLGYT